MTVHHEGFVLPVASHPPPRCLRRSPGARHCIRRSAVRRESAVHGTCPAFLPFLPACLSHRVTRGLTRLLGRTGVGEKTVLEVGFRRCVAVGAPCVPIHACL